MKIKVIGKSHLEGVGKKSGKPYSFNQFHFTAPARGVEGMAAQTVNVDPAIIPIASVIIGHEYDVDFDQRGYCVDMQPVSVPIK